jgi:RNA polymerase sigma-70 factor (ECF subfamily)
MHGANFADLVREHQAMVYSIAYHALENRAQAEDLAQEVFLCLHENLARLESEGHAAHWLRRVTANRCIDEIRRRKYRRGPALEDVAEPAAGPRLADPLLERQLRESLAELPETARLVTILRFQEEMDPPEIAAALGIPVGTVKSRLHRALRVLKEKMERRAVARAGRAAHGL